MNRRLTRRRCLLGIALLFGLVAAVLVLREARYLAQLPSPVLARMPAHFRIPSALAPEVREGIEGCYARLSDDRLQAAHNLGNLGPAAAPTVPWLMALLADEQVGSVSSGSNPAATPTLPTIGWSACEDWPIIGHLIKLLRGPRGYQCHPDSTPEACAALAEIGPAAVGPLIKCLRDDLPRVRMHAAVALGNIADPRAIEPLAALLEDPDFRPRVAAALALGQFREERAVTHLAETLLHTTVKGEQADVREAASQGLLMMGPVAWPSLVEALKSEDREVRIAVARGWNWDCDCQRLLSRRISRELAMALVSALGDPDEEVARRAACALIYVKDPCVVDGLVAAVSHPSAPVRQSVGEALANFSGPKVADALAALLKDSDNCARAACQLAKLGDKRAFESLIEPLGMPGLYNDRGEEIATQAIEALAALGDTRAVPPLLDSLRSSRGPSLLVRDSPCPEGPDPAASALALLKDARAIPGLVDACRRWPDSTAVRAALASFGTAAVEPLLKSLQDGESVEGSIRALAQIGDRRAVEPLQAALTGDNPVVRVEAAAALVRFGDSRAIGLVTEGLRDPETGYAAVKALGHLKDKRAVGPLRALLAQKAAPEEEEEGHETAPDDLDLGELGRAALEALLSIGDPDAIASALEYVYRDYHELVWVRPASLDINLGLIPEMGPAAVGPLQKALSNPVVLIRCEAGKLLLLTDVPGALAALRTTFSRQDLQFVYYFSNDDRKEEAAKRTEPLLEILAAHKDRLVRRAAAGWLSKNRDPRVIPALRRAAASDICPSVRHAAWVALEELTGAARPAGVPPRWLDEYNPGWSVLLERSY